MEEREEKKNRMKFIWIQEMFALRSSFNDKSKIDAVTSVNYDVAWNRFKRISDLFRIKGKCSN